MSRPLTSLAFPKYLVVCLFFNLFLQTTQGNTLRKRVRVRHQAWQETLGKRHRKSALPPLLSCCRRKPSIPSQNGQRYLSELASFTQGIPSFDSFVLNLILLPEKLSYIHLNTENDALRKSIHQTN